MNVRAEIISIGDELTSGQRLDTNSRWLSEQLGNLGVKAVFHTTVGDSMQDNIDAFRTAARRADVVIASGGLGPTADDLTREAIANAFDSPLELRQEALDYLESLFAKRKRPMPERNRAQAMFPTGSRIIDNPHGTAPGIDLSVSTTHDGIATASRIFSLPGVPAEMMQMFSATVEPRLIQEMGVGGKRWYFHSLKVFGIGESDVEKLLPDLIHRDRDPLVGITVSNATITLRIAALCENKLAFKTKIESTIQQIRETLGLLVFGEGELDIDAATNQLLLLQGLRLGVVEVGAGAWIQHYLSQQSGLGEKGLQAAQWFPSLADVALHFQDGPAPNLLVAKALDDEPATDSVNRLAKAAESLLVDRDLDLCLGAGCYPTREFISSATTLPTSEFTFVLARRGKKTKHTTVSLGAHPEVIYHRLAKAGLNYLRLELVQNG